jgi:asparagine N-glycosylation enzyme membrane subunit Stt3
LQITRRAHRRIQELPGIGEPVVVVAGGDVVDVVVLVVVVVVVGAVVVVVVGGCTTSTDDPIHLSAPVVLIGSSRIRLRTEVVK